MLFLNFYLFLIFFTILNTHSTHLILLILQKTYNQLVGTLAKQHLIILNWWHKIYKVTEDLFGR